MKKIYTAIDSILKNDDGTIVVSGYASSGNVDSDGEIVTPEAMRAAIPDYMKFGAVREMHGKSAAGTAIDAKVLDDGKTAFSALIVDPIAIKKVEAGVYKGFSIGGRVIDRDKDVIKQLQLIEVSLVDRPANPEAVITMYKADELEKRQVEEVVKSESVEVEAVEESVEVVTEKSPTEKSESAEIEKAGSKYSATTKAALGDLHKMAMDMCAKFAALGYSDDDGDAGDSDNDGDKEKAAASDDLNKFESIEKALSDVRGELEKAMGVNAELKDQIEKQQKQIETLKSTPTAPKAHVTSVVSKEDDTKADEVKKSEKVPEPGTQERALYEMKNVLFSR